MRNPSLYPQSSEFGCAIKNWRKAAKITQGELASKCGINRATLSFIECGAQSVSLEQAYRLSIAIRSFLDQLKGTS